MTRCNRPPAGWHCNLERDHDGPCPTYPDTGEGSELEEWMRVMVKYYGRDLLIRYPYGAARLYELLSIPLPEDQKIAAPEHSETLRPSGQMVPTIYPQDGLESFTFHNGHARVHPATACDPDYPCTIHRPSEHKMRDWPMYLRETGLVERLCADHKIGHPDPDSAAWLNREGPEGSRGTWGRHGCDGCCQ